MRNSVNTDYVYAYVFYWNFISNNSNRNLEKRNESAVGVTIENCNEKRLGNLNH